MHRLAVVAQSFLREPLRVADGLGAFRPSVSIAVERNAFEAKLQLGQPTNSTSLPVDYTLTGVLLVPPRIGGKVKVLRTTRNGIEVPGVFESTEVVEIGEHGFTTFNSVYLLKTISKEECRL